MQICRNFILPRLSDGELEPGLMKNCKKDVFMLQMQNNLPTEPPNYSNLGVSGFGGWLVLVQISLYASILSLLIRLGQYTYIFVSQEAWRLFTSPTSSVYHPLWGPAVIFETFYFVSMFIYCIVVLILFYSKKRVLPKLMIILFSVGLLFAVVDGFLIFQIPLALETQGGAALREIVKCAIICAIWIPYFLKSERVKNTFIW